MRLNRITDNMEGTAATLKMVMLTRKIKIKGGCARTHSVALRSQTVTFQVTHSDDPHINYLSSGPLRPKHGS
jgi:hypothetical protein